MRRQGRPTRVESARRQRRLIELLVAGRPWREAADEARVKPDTVLGLLDDPQFLPVAAAVLRDRATPGLNAAA